MLPDRRNCISASSAFSNKGWGVVSKQLQVIIFLMLVGAGIVVLIAVATSKNSSGSSYTPSPQKAEAFSDTKSSPRAASQSSTWYYIGGNSQSEAGAEQQARSLGAGWHTLGKDMCTNFTKGWYTVVKGPFSTEDAARQSGSGGYAKSCD